MFEFDPFDPAYYADPWPYYATMRDEHPVYCREIPDHRVWPRYWMLSRAADVDEGLADWRTFSSAQGTLIDTDISLLPPNMFNMDPPRHDELRSILARVLTPRRVENLEPVVRAYARELIDAVRADGAMDVSTQFAQMVPTITMCTLMDLPRADRPKFLKWNLDTLAGADFTSPDALAAYGEMAVYWTGLVAERREAPGNDLISQIIHTEVDGDPLSDEEIGGFCSLLHDAAQNTTMNMLTHGVLELGRHPDQRAKLVADRTKWPRAVDELMRYVSPVQGLARTTTRDVELHGVTIPKGEQVLMLYGSANHDERTFPDPERFDIDRTPKANYGFGHGIHHCLGNAVAKLEIRCALDEVVQALGDWQVDEPSIELNQLVPTRGVAHARISFDAK
jgi:cytochrome P450